MSDDFRRKLLIAYGISVFCGGVIALCLYTPADTQPFKATVTGELDGGMKPHECVDYAIVHCIGAGMELNTGLDMRCESSTSSGASFLMSAKGYDGTINFHVTASEVRGKMGWNGVWRVDVSADNKKMFDKAVRFLNKSTSHLHPIAETQPADVGGELAN